MVMICGYVAADGDIWSGLTWDTDFIQDVAGFNSSYTLDSNASFYATAELKESWAGCGDWEGYDGRIMNVNITTKSCEGFNVFTNWTQGGGLPQYVWVFTQGYTETTAPTITCSEANAANITCSTPQDCTINDVLGCCINSSRYNDTIDTAAFEISVYSQSYVNDSFTKKNVNYTTWSPKIGAGADDFYTNNMRIEDTYHASYGCEYEAEVNVTNDTERCCRQIYLYEDDLAGGPLENAFVSAVGYDGTTYTTDNVSQIEETEAGLYVLKDAICQPYTLNVRRLPEYPLKEYSTFYPACTPSFDEDGDWEECTVGDDCNPLGFVCDKQTYDQSFNITFRVLDWGNINILENQVRAYQCNTELQCVNLNPFNADECQSILGYMLLNASGVRIWYDALANRPVLCGQSKHLGAGIDKRIPWVGYYGGKNVEFNFTYGLDIIPYTLCFDFIDSVTLARVNYVNFTLTQDGLSKLIDNTSEAEYCFNTTKTTDAERTYLVKAYKYGYDPFTLLHMFDLGTTETFTLTPTESNVDSAYKYNVSGYALLSDVVKPNVKIKSSCHTLQTTTNPSGLYNFTRIVKGTSCCFESVSVEYTSGKVCRTVNSDLTDVNITLTQKATDKYDVAFHVVQPGIFENEYDDVFGANVRIRLPNIPWESCTTGTNGYCTIHDVTYGGNYQVVIDNLPEYNTYRETKKLTDMEYPIVLNPKTGEFCRIFGTTKTQNGTVTKPVSVTVQLYDKTGYSKLKETGSSITQDGYYEFDVACGTSYIVKTEYSNIKLQGSVTLAAGEGHDIPQHFTFDMTQVSWGEQVNNFIIFLQGLLIFGYVFIVMFGLYLFKILWDKLNR